MICFNTAGSDKEEMKDQNTRTGEIYFHLTLECYNGCRTIHSFTAVGFDKVELKDKQIQTETMESMELHVEAENMTDQQGVYTTV